MVLARLASCPPIPRQASQPALTATPSGQAAARSESQARPARGYARIVKPETVSNLFARPLCLRAFVVWSVVARYNYPLIVITKCRRYQNPAPRKSSLCLSPSPPAPQARPASCARSRVRAAGRMALWPIIVHPLSKLRGFAPSREPVVLAHLASCPPVSARQASAS